MSSDPRDVTVVSVFADGPGGGNPAPIVLDAAALSAADMQEVARRYGHESGFVLPAPVGSGCDLRMRYWVPRHEMAMCGHATVGAVWLLAHTGRVPAPTELRVFTDSGVVECQVRRDADSIEVAISQPAARLEPIDRDSPDGRALLAMLGIAAHDLADTPVQNATTSRTKTLIPLRDAARLDALTPRWEEIEALCDRLDSTGLYPFAVSDADRGVVDARQFPRSSGYPEDAATGIAAAALAFGLAATGPFATGPFASGETPITVRQGRAMGRPSRISVRLDVVDGAPARCWLGGAVRLDPDGPRR